MERKEGENARKCLSQNGYTWFVKPDRYKTDIHRSSYIFFSFILDEATMISILNAFSVRLADTCKGPFGSSVRQFISG